MELAGLKIQVGADFSEVFESFSKASSALNAFNKQVQGAFNKIPDIGKKINFKANGASQAAQDTREYATAQKEAAIAARELARAEEIKERAARATERSRQRELDEYGKLVAANNALVRQYYNAAAAVIKYGDAAGITADDLEELRKKAEEGQKTLQQIEAGAGRFQRNVGNYASGFNPLQNSINQLSREMPAFANSLQTGFMAISNNLPALADALKGIRAQNAALAAEGKPTVSVIKQIGSALFSWQTALSVGITLLTVYGADLVNMIKGEKDSKASKERLKQAQDDLNASIESANSFYGQQMGKLRSLEAVTMSNTASKKQQQAAYQELQSIYPSYLQNMSLEQARTGGLARIINNELVPAIMAAAQARAVMSDLENNFKRQRDLSQKYLTTLGDVAKAQERNARIQKQANQGGLDPATQAGLAVSQNAIGSGTQNILNKAIKERELVERDLNKVYQERESLMREITDLSGRTGNLSIDGTDAMKGGGAGGGASKAAKDVRTLADVLDDFGKANDETARKMQAGIITKTEKLSEEMQALEQFIIGATAPEIKGALGFDDDLIKNSIQGLQSLKTELEGAEAAAAKMTAFKDVFNTLQESLKEADIKESLPDRLSALETALFALQKSGINAPLVLDNLKQSISGIKGEIQGEELAKRMTDFRNALATLDASESNGLITGLDATKERISLLKKEMDAFIASGDYVSAKQIKINIETENAVMRLQELEDKFNQLVQETMVKGAEEIGSGIGNALSGEGVKGIFSGFGNMLATQLDSLGKILIQHGIQMMALQKILTQSITNPTLAIGAGVAMVALAQLTRQKLSKRASKGTNFASGGVVYGETFARVGEYSNARGNPEIIAPLDRLKSLLGNVGGGVREVPYIVSTKVAGSDLRIVLNRANEEYSR